MVFLEKWRKRRAILDYARNLPKLLARDYGHSLSYFPRQVRSTIERYGLSGDYSCYAISMFSDRAAFEQYHVGIGEVCDYNSMRTEVAEAHFNGNIHFMVTDIMQVFSDGGHSTWTSDHHGAVNGYFDGGGKQPP